MSESNSRSAKGLVATSASATEILVQFRDQDALDGLLEHIEADGLFLPGRLEVERGMAYSLVLIHPDGQHRLQLAATVVQQTEGVEGGVAFHLTDFDEASRERLVGFVQAASTSRERTLFERISKMSSSDQRKLARSSSLEERMIVERLMGKLVWEELLRNPSVTPPEVARIAQRHDLPFPIVSLIVEGEKWLRHADIRRALLANPRLSGAGVVKVLRVLNRHELAALLKERTTPAAVRMEAQKLFRRFVDSGKRR